MEPNDYYKKHYQDNKEKYLERNRQRKQEATRLMIEAKTGKPCADCNTVYPHYCMDFDHIEDNKERAVSRMAAGGEIKKMLKEIEKCELVCSNCHRKRTYERAHGSTECAPVAELV